MFLSWNHKIGSQPGGYLVLLLRERPSPEPGRAEQSEMGNSLSESSLSYLKSFPFFEPKLVYLWSHSRENLPLFSNNSLQIIDWSPKNHFLSAYVLRACQLILTTIL